MALSSQAIVVEHTTTIHEPAVKATPVKTVLKGYVLGVVIDNSLNSVPIYFRLYNNANPIVGTTAEFFQLKVGAGETVFHPFINGTMVDTATAGINGINVSTSIAFACTTDAGTGTTAPTSNVSVTLLSVALSAE